MSALPNPLHTERKGPAQAKRPAKLNRYGRDPGSPSERLRDSSDFDTEKGYAPFFHAFLADWGRLSSGHVSDMLFMTVLSKSLGRSVRKGEPRPNCTAPLLVSDLREICGCDERSIQRELAGWHARKVAKVTQAGKGLVAVELLYRDWEGLPDYKNVVEITTGKPVPEAKDTTRIDLTKEPVTCKAGGRSKGVKVDQGIKNFHLVNASVIDLEITAMVQAGDLVITSRPTAEWLDQAVKRASVVNGINNLESPPRHGGHGFESKPIAKTTAKAIDCTHPRAPELVKLFDPILAASASRLLSGDTKALQAACEAVGDCEHDFLLKFSIQRAERPVKSPLHVPTICGEALASWKASKLLDRAGLPKRHDAASREEIDALIATERAERLRRKK